MDTLTIETYSDKAIILCGDTKPFKEQIKAMGGRWNPNLVDPDNANRRFGAWIFPKKDKDMLGEWLADTPTPRSLPRRAALNRIPVRQVIRRRVMMTQEQLDRKLLGYRKSIRAVEQKRMDAHLERITEHNVPKGWKYLAIVFLLLFLGSLMA